MLVQASKLTPRQAVRLLLDPEGTVKDVWPADLPPLPEWALDMIAALGRYALAYHRVHGEEPEGM